MSNVGGVNGSSSVYGVGSFDGGMGGMSPDALLEYCQMQMSNLSGQVDGLEKQMQQQTDDQQTVKNLQAQIEQIGGSNGPQSVQDMQKVYDAYQQAINSMPDGDPTKAALQKECDDTFGSNGYDFHPAQALTPEQQQQLKNDQDIINKKVDLPNEQAAQKWQKIVEAAKKDMASLQDQQTGSIGKKPDSQSWKGTVEGVGNIASQINSDFQMQMLDLQQLASQQQNATELTIQLLQKTDSTLLDVAKNA